MSEEGELTPLPQKEAISRLPDRKWLLVWFPGPMGSFLGRRATKEQVRAKLEACPTFEAEDPPHFCIEDALVRFEDEDGVHGWVSAKAPGERIDLAWPDERKNNMELV